MDGEVVDSARSSFSAPEVGDEVQHVERVRSCTAFPRTSAEKRLFCWVLGIKLVVIILGFVLMWISYAHTDWIVHVIESMQLWIKQSGIAGLVLFVSVYVLITTLFVPAEILTVASGFIFPPIYTFYGGFALAYFLCMISQLASTAVCFTLARSLLHNPIELFFGHNTFYRSFMSAVSEGGTCFVALLRLSPVIPFSLSNYLLGLTALPLHSVLIGACASTPLVLIMIWIGTAISDLRVIESGGFQWSPVRLGLMGFGVILATVAALFIGIKTKKKLDSAARLIDGTRDGNSPLESQNDSHQSQNSPLLSAGGLNSVHPSPSA